MLYMGAQLTVEEAKAFNEKQANFRWSAIQSGYGVGCVRSMACENCGLMVHDSICLCIGIFTCPKCGVTLGIFGELKWNQLAK